MNAPPGGTLERSLPALHVVTDDAVLGERDFLDRAVRVMSRGGPSVALHIRGPRTPGRTLYEVAGRLLQEARRSRAMLFVNDRVDVALTLGTCGVHLGRRSLPAGVVRQMLGPGPAIGVSRTASEEPDLTGVEGADYAFVGTVFPTESHRSGPSIGIDGLSGVVAIAGPLPIIAIGGISVDRVSDVRETGAHGVAVIRGVWGETDPSSAVQEYLEALERA